MTDSTVQQKRDQLAAKLRALAAFIEEGIIDQWQFQDSEVQQTPEGSVRAVHLKYLRVSK
jgi:hypothetical protein